jgi:hypothetical protein
MTNVHDSGYKILFSNRTIFRQLMESFVAQPWVAQLDFDRAERVDKSFVSEEYQQTESDLIYRLPWGEDELYVYVLLEFQSTVDKWMALRMLNYITDFYMSWRKDHEDAQKLPPIFPLLLYNGDERWRAATSNPKITPHWLKFIVLLRRSPVCCSLLSRSNMNNGIRMVLRKVLRRASRKPSAEPRSPCSPAALTLSSSPR